jgi:uncharacterized phage-like protein YoqJ
MLKEGSLRLKKLEVDRMNFVRGEDGRWYHNGLLVPTSVAQYATRQDEIYLAVTGHRDLSKRTVEAAKWWIEKIAQKYPQATIITGGAIGTDLLVAQLAIKAELKSKVYLPFEFETHTARWNQTSKAQLRWVLDRSEIRVVGGHQYSVKLYHRRNERMVDNADVILAFWDGREDGGTASCIRYAQHRGKRVFDAFSRGEIGALPGENIYEKLDARHDSNNDTIDYFDDATLFSSIFKIDLERHGDGTEGNEAKERELAQVSPFKLKYYFQSADYYISNGVVFERHEDIGYRDRDSIACRIKMATKCTGEEARKVAEYLEIVDQERRLEDQWVKWLRKDFNRTVAYLEKLYVELVNCEPDVELEALLEWIGVSDLSACNAQADDQLQWDELDNDGVVVRPRQVQSWNDDPSEDGWDELEDDGVMVDPSYGWHRLNDPRVSELPIPTTAAKLSPVALPIYQKIQSLSGHALAGYGKTLYQLWEKWKSGGQNSFQQRDWDELWAAYKYRKDSGVSLRA